MLAICTPCAWIAFAIDITITLKSKARVNDFATQPGQVVTLKIGPTSWIALAAAVSQSFPIHPQQQAADILARSISRDIGMDDRCLSQTPIAGGPPTPSRHTEGLTGISQVHEIF